MFNYYIFSVYILFVKTTLLWLVALVANTGMFRSVLHFLLRQYSVATALTEDHAILKKSSLDPAVLGNYRPISNLPFISKVFERAVNERMLVHLQTNGLMLKH